jgi:hypothetical protein
MSILQFSDGEEFDLGGELRIEHRSDGYYVVGENYLCAVDSLEEGQDLIEEIGGAQK